MKKVSISTVVTVIFGVFAVITLVSPDVKAWVSMGLMKVGFFRPNLSYTESESQSAAANAQARPSVFVNDGDGNRMDIANQPGKVVFVNFWATWCPPCIAELPSIDKLYQQFKDNDAIVFAMVDVDGQYEKSKQFMQNKNLDLPVHKAIGKIPADWLGNAIPTTLIIDKQGRIAAKHEGMADYSRPEVVAFINELIAME